MRDIPDALVARLASGVTILANVWRIERRDGEVFGFTDHDRALIFGELICEPAAGLVGGAVEKSLGLAIDSASLRGALSSEAITEEDLARGLWDGARVDLCRVDWSDAALYVHLFAGHIGEAKRGVLAFEAELRGLQAPLNLPVGRVFSRYCDADVGDARCGVDLESSAYRGEGIVTEVLGDRVFRASGLEAFAEGWFARGRLAWSDGRRSEVAAHRLEGVGAVIEVLDARALDVAVGAAFVVHAGCDKSLATCRAKFANAVSFRGFPHMPGNDAVQAGPTVHEPLDGSSRFR